ncbi:hypothetical protein PMIT1342_00130 [Prochlorococcus marinus str. MIT 1342]|nr:hypothetical protein PMIT1342_00130 [Prochlorococcus marinus str. MIT 1342]
MWLMRIKICLPSFHPAVLFNRINQPIHDPAKRGVFYCLLTLSKAETAYYSGQQQKQGILR